MSFQDDKDAVMEVLAGIEDCKTLAELKEHRGSIQHEIDALPKELQNIARVAYQMRIDARIDFLRGRLAKVDCKPYMVNWAAKYRDEVNADRRVYKMLKEATLGVSMTMDELKRLVDEKQGGK